MAGEVQDCLTYQADSLHTGSVSFGRYESEPLSWERRSSFSHNRYLEEVEKCSTPGSVIQKKAYFEAHFKKKGLLYPASPGSLYTVGNNATENGSHDHPDHIEDWENDDDGDENHFAHFDETAAVSDEHEEMGGEEQEVISPELASLSEYSQKQDLCYDKICEDAAIDAEIKNDTVGSQPEIFSIPSDQKGLLYPASPGSLYTVGNNATENGSHDHPDHIEDWENDDDGDENHFAHFDETAAVSDEHEEMGGEEQEVISPELASPSEYSQKQDLCYDKICEDAAIDAKIKNDTVGSQPEIFSIPSDQKGLLYPASPGSLYTVGNNATENGSHDLPDHIEDWENDDDGDENHSAHFDETPAVSDEHEEMGGEEQEVISPELASPSEYSQKQDLCYDKICEDAAIDAEIKNDTVRSQPKFFSIPSDQKTGDEFGGIVEESTERRDITSKNTTISKKKDPSLEKRENPDREKKAVELRSSKVNQWSQIPVAKGSIEPSSVKSSLSSSKLNKTLDKVDGENKVKKESEKRSSLRISLSSDSKNQKAMDSSSAKAIVKPENIRSAHLASSIKMEVKQSTAAFNFRSDERAEKRREFFMKLEEKLHAKEAEMNEIQARTQEETEAKIKQLRKSLNFKATPMPSFYHGATPRIPGAKKTAATPRSSSKLQTRSTPPGTKPSSRDKSAAHPELTSKERSSNGEPTAAGKGDGNAKRGEVSRVRRSSGAGKAMKSMDNGDLAVDVSS